ncbi:MAG TPA: hypothetical protein VGP57_24535 [Actinoplanes sp.]|nr:hypothetical protein [Actinoplanes sp.]
MDNAPVRALVRNADGVPHGVTGDLNRPDTLRPALEGVDGLFLLPGYQDMPGVPTEAEDAGAFRRQQNGRPESGRPSFPCFRSCR